LWSTEALMVAPCAVLIAAPEFLPALRQRTGHPDNFELLTFSDAEALRALEVITKRRPRVVTLERLFAATPRGAALIHRIKADPSLVQSEIRVVAHGDADVQPPAQKADPASSVAAATAAAVPLPALDPRGTRRAPRFRMAGQVDVMIDGNAATLVDLSTVGAQVICATILKPNQRVRMALPDDAGTVRVSATVAWASFEIPPQSGARYRAGVAFAEADDGTVDGFCERHRHQ
jgi:hypothetical protein